MSGNKKRRLTLFLVVVMFVASVTGYTNISQAETGSGESEGFANFNYSLLTTDDRQISTKSSGVKATVLVFGRTTCGNTQATISGLAKSAYAATGDIHVVYADIDEAEKEEVQSFAQTYGDEYMDFCYKYVLTEENPLYGNSIGGVMWQYLDSMGIAGTVMLPVTVLIDKNDRIENILTGPQEAETLKNEIDKFADIPLRPVESPTPYPSPTGGTVSQNTQISTQTQEPDSAATATPKLKKQKISVKTTRYVVKMKKRKKMTFKLGAKTSGNGKLTYQITKYPKKLKKKFKKYIKVSKAGKVTIKKGIKKGNYKIKITAAKTGKYKKAVKVITITI